MQMDDSNDEEEFPLDVGLTIGHTVGATVLFAFGVCGMLLTWTRLRDLPVGTSFCTEHVPERNTTLMTRFAKTIMIATSAGWWVEALGACIDSRIETHHCLLYQFGHEAIYTMYFMIGPVMWLEANHRLPPDSWRVMFGLSNLLVTMFWESHASLKRGPDAAIHSYMGVITFACALTTLYSVTHPENLFSYVATFGCLILNGMWLYTSALTFSIGMLPLHMVGPVFCLESSGLALFLMISHALIVPQSFSSRGQFQQLFSKDIDCADDSTEEEEELA